MDREELTKQIERLVVKSKTHSNAREVFLEVKEFLRQYAGPESAFFEQFDEKDPQKIPDSIVKRHAVDAITGFQSYVESGLQQDITPERQAQLDVVSDYLEMAQNLLEDKKVHAAAPAVIIGALHSFKCLRTQISEAR